MTLPSGSRTKKNTVPSGSSTVSVIGIPASFKCLSTAFRSVKTLNEIFNTLKLEKHPDKTFIGRIERGFDFLGYHFSPRGLGLARKTVENFLVRATRLYEQEREKPEGPSVLELYMWRWVSWIEGGLGADKKNPASAGRFLFTKDQSSLFPH